MLLQLVFLYSSLKLFEKKLRKWEWIHNVKKRSHDVDELDVSRHVCSIWRAINFIFNELMTNRKWKYRNIKLWQQNVDQLWLIKMFQLQVFLNSSEKFIGRCFFSDVCCGKNERQSCWRQACTWKIAPETGERKWYLDFKKILQN